MYFRKNDIVQVIAGDDAGTRGKVIRVLREKNKVVIEGVNQVYKHLKPTQKNPRGGRLSKEMPVDASNVALVDPSTNTPTRLGVRYLPDGSKELYAKKSGTRIRVISKPNPKYAQKG